MNTDQNQTRRDCLCLLSAFICVHLWFISCALAEKHEFIFDASHDSPPPQHVNVAGDFNGWSKVATPLNNDGHGEFTTTLDLSDGIHYYKFVIDGENWRNDTAHSDK